MLTASTLIIQVPWHPVGWRIRHCYATALGERKTKIFVFGTIWGDDDGELKRSLGCATEPPRPKTKPLGPSATSYRHPGPVVHLAKRIAFVICLSFVIFRFILRYFVCYFPLFATLFIHFFPIFHRYFFGLLLNLFSLFCYFKSIFFIFLFLFCIFSFLYCLYFEGFFGCLFWVILHCVEYFFSLQRSCLRCLIPQFSSPEHSEVKTGQNRLCLGSYPDVHRSDPLV